ELPLVKYSAAESNNRQFFALPKPGELAADRRVGPGQAGERGAELGDTWAVAPAAAVCGTAHRAREIKYKDHMGWPACLVLEDGDKFIQDRSVRREGYSHAGGSRKSVIESYVCIDRSSPGARHQNTLHGVAAQPVQDPLVGVPLIVLEKHEWVVGGNNSFLRIDKLQRLR